jgi:hypothetical protein
MPVMNAFVVLLLITAIYAVVATMFFYKYDNVQFGKFSASLYTMFQVCMCLVECFLLLVLKRFSHKFFRVVVHHVSGVHW